MLKLLIIKVYISDFLTCSPEYLPKFFHTIVKQFREIYQRFEHRFEKYHCLQCESSCSAIRTTHRYQTLIASNRNDLNCNPITQLVIV